MTVAVLLTGHSLEILIFLFKYQHLLMVSLGAMGLQINHVLK